MAHLLRRTGFGPTPAELDAATAAGYDATVDRLLDFTAPDPADATPPPSLHAPTARRNLTVAQRKALRQAEATQLRALQLWWLGRMASTAHPLREKLTLFWHGHFATSFDKVRSADLMYRQNQLFRTMGSAGFEALTQAVAKDPAMMVWLDTRTDKAARPNENFARELMELFTLGIGNYSETDVREAARAFTGWVIDPLHLSWALQPRQHDSGPKTFLGQTGNWGGEDIVHLVVNAPAGEAFIVARLWSHFAYPVAPTDPVVRDLLPGYAKDHDITALLRAVLHHPGFTSATARTGLVKQPIEWVVGAIRALSLTGPPGALVGALTELGQTPFRPPNVGGWPQNTYWLNTATSLARLNIAAALAGRADLTPFTDPTAAARLLSVTWSDTTARALAAVGADRKMMVTLALSAPEYVLA